MAARLVVRALALGLVTPVLVACQSKTESYCQGVSEHQEELTDLVSRDDAAALFEANDIYRSLAEDAPDDIGDEYEVVIDAIDRLESTVEDLGIDPSTYDPKNPPRDLSDADVDRLRAAAVGLVDPTTVAAMDSVEQQARDVCRTPLTL